MGASKKKIKQKINPEERKIRQFQNADAFYNRNPAWNFSNCDKEQWSIYSTNVRNIFWDEIFPRLQNLEKQNWKDILVNGKKHNHSIKTESLNKIAIDRLNKLYMEAESLISLKVTGTHRIYGYINDFVFNILWIDLNHGDNSDCVCRSKKKNT